MPSDSPEGTLSFYGLYNEPQQTGFSSYDLLKVWRKAFPTPKNRLPR